MGPKKYLSLIGSGLGLILLLPFQNCTGKFNSGSLDQFAGNISLSSQTPPAPPVVETPPLPKATWLKPFSAQSPWNSRPTKFTLSDDEVPKSDYFPFIGGGEYSLKVFLASPSDPAVTVMGPEDRPGIWKADDEIFAAQIIIPHWPVGTAGASGDDGHADIIDVENNVIHSFWQLRTVNGQMRAAQYTWAPLNGSGFGTPGQYMQGSRAAGVVSLAGLIRKHEIDDGEPMYHHALTMSMTFNGLSASPAYVFPATSADYDAATTNTGRIPEGALMMLPPSFDLAQISDPKLLKIARTLKTYGAYVVDRNWGTPYIIYVENGANFNMMPNGWDNSIASALDLLRASLKQVVSSSDWVDGNGNAFTPEQKLNQLSMRGSWWPVQGTSLGVFDSWKQAVVFPQSGQPIEQVNTGGRSLPQQVNWAVPQAGQIYRLQVKAKDGASLKLDLVVNGITVATSGNLRDGGSVLITWPSGSVNPQLRVYSNAQGGGEVSGTLIRQ